MSGCICGRCCGENRTDPDCPECNPKVLAKTNFKGAREGMVRDAERNVAPKEYVSEFPVVNGIDVNSVGHGHVWPRKDGNRMRCMGPSGCKYCKVDKARKDGMSLDMLPVKEFQKSVELLAKAAGQFRYYERQHRQKMIDPNIGRGKLVETFDKAEANAAIAKEIEDQINEFQNRSKTETPRD